MVGDRERALATGFDGYLSKPIDPAAFVPQVEAFLAAHLRSRVSIAPSASAPPRAKPEPNGRTILILDNLQDNLDLAREIFASAGYAVVTATEPKQALDLAQQVLPDVIMSDVCMPSGSGYEFITQVKSDPRLRRLPFVFVTSTAVGESDRTKGLALGADRYLFRPIDPDKLLGEVEACLKGAGEA
jgi:two-component system cell cycle response regulator